MAVFREVQPQNKELKNLVPHKILKDTGIDPDNPLGTVISRGGARCIIFQGVSLGEEENLFLIKKSHDVVNGLSGKSSMWYLAGVNSQAVDKVLRARPGDFSPITNEAVAFMDGLKENRVYGRDLPALLLEVITTT